MRILLLLAVAVWAQDTPYFNRATDKDQDVGAINQNFRDLADRSKDKITGNDTPGDTCYDNPTFCVDATNHRVGIGISSPSYKLDVNGASHFANTITSDGNLISNSSFSLNGGVFGTINASTSGVLATNITTTDITPTSCNVTGSTLTLSMQNVRADLIFNGTTVNDTGGGGCRLTIQKDGTNAIDNYTSSLPMTESSNDGSNSGAIFPTNIFYRTRTALSAGSHNFCLSLSARTAGACTLRCASTPCYFEIREVR